jgi:anti-anti-sigma factor
MSQDFDVTIETAPKEGMKIVHLKGELDELSIETLRVELEPLLNDHSVSELVFDLNDLEFINSKGIGYVVSVHTHLAKDNRALRLTSAQEAVMDVIGLVGLTAIIPYFDTLEEVKSA